MNVLSPPGDFSQIALVAEIREQHRQRQHYHQAEKGLTNRIRAIERRMSGGQRSADTRELAAATGEDGDDPLDVPALPAVPRRGATVPGIAAATIHLAQARGYLAHFRRLHERRMMELARQLPVWPWVEAVRGIGPLGLAQLVGESGDLSNYSNPAKLWKRMGLAVIAGGRQRRVADAADALVHGYDQERRAVMFNLGEALVKQNQGGPYRSLYLARKAHETAAAANRICVSSPFCRRESPNPPFGCVPGHLHNRARRYMEKRFLVDLWIAWKGKVKP